MARNKVYRAADDAAKKTLLRAMEQAGWNMTEAGVSLGASCQSVRKMMLRFAPREYEKARRVGLIQHGGQNKLASESLRKKRAT